MKHTLFAALFLAAVVGWTAAEKKLNVTGTWRLDAERSDFGGLPAPEGLSWVIKDSDEKIVMEETGGDGNTITLVFLRGGKESANRFGSREMRTKLIEENGALKEDTVITSSEGDRMTRTSSTTMSDDGKTLTQAMVIKGPQGEIKRTLVLNKK